MNNIPNVFILTAVNNHWEFTKKFLKCAANQSYKKCKIIVVDDGSTDRTSEKIRNKYPNVITLKGDGNLWWTGSLYMACEYVLKYGDKNDYFLTINNDCTFPNNYVSSLVETISKSQKTIVGSVATSTINKNKIVDSGAKINWIRGSVNSAVIKDKCNFDIDALSTRGTMFPVSIIHEIGNFDKRHLPHYVSDFEYTCRAKKHGYTLMTDSSIIITNDDSRTGSTGPLNKAISFNVLKKMLFDRKSQINIIDHFYFIYLCCPWYLQPLNYIYLIAKLVYLGSFLKPFFPYRKPIVKLRSFLLYGVK